MSIKIRKFFFGWDFEKEEAWLNKMSAEGLQLQAVDLHRYIFEEGLSNEYIYRIEILNKSPTHPKNVKYIRFIEDTGAEKIDSCSNWVYFRKKTGDVGFDKFLSIDLRITYLIKLLWLFAFSFILLLINSWNSFERHSNLIVIILFPFLSVLSVYGFIQTYIKKSQLKKEKELNKGRRNDN